MTQEIEEELEEEDTIQPMDDETGTPNEPPLSGGHLPFGEMGITPPLEDRVMGVYNFMFDQQENMIMKQRQICFSNDPQNLVSVSIEKAITTNTRRYTRVIMATIVAFTTIAKYYYEYFLNENVILRRELVAVKQ